MSSTVIYLSLIINISLKRFKSAENDPSYIPRIWFTDESRIEIDSYGRRGNKGKILPKCQCPPWPERCSCLNKKRPILQKKKFAKSIMVFAAVRFDRKPFYLIFDPPPKPKKGEKPERGINARRYQEEAIRPFQKFLIENNYHQEENIFMQGNLES